MNSKQAALAVTLMVALVPATLLQPAAQTTAAGALPVLQTQPQSPRQTLPPDAGAFYGAPQSFLILNSATGRVEEVPVDQFVRGAVAAEMPALYHPEALKAQAVAAYTYAVRQALQQRQTPSPDLQGADFAADPQNMQVYITEEQARSFYGENFDYYWHKVCAAAEAAAGYLLLYEGQPAATAYHAISAGQTEAAEYVWQGEELPYLQAVESEGDLLAAGYESSLTLPAARLAQKLEEALPDLQLPQDTSRWLEVTERSPSGYATTVQVGDRTMTGAQLRFLLGLRSSCFEVTEQNGQFTFAVRGYGHGVGLSQNGADYMARQGAGFDEILLHYYPGTSLALAAAGG